MKRRTPLLFAVAALWAAQAAPLHAKDAAKAPDTAPEKPGRVITLEQAYDRTLATDQSIRIAYYEIRKANLLPWSALARMGPGFTGNASYDTSRSTRSGIIGVDGISVPTSRSDSESRSAGLTLQQPLLDLTVFPAYRLGKLSAQSARLQYRFTVRETLFGVAQAYYNVLKQQSVVAINQQTLDLAKDQVDRAQIRLDVGTAPRIDVTRAKATLEDARFTLIQSQGALESSRDTLSNILNLGGKTDFVLAEPPAAPSEAAPFEPLLKTAFSKREDYQISAIAIDQDTARRNEIIAEYGPRVVAQASTQWSSGSGTGSGRTRVNDGVISVQLPFLTGGQREIDLRAAGHQIEQTRLNYEKTWKSIEAEVKNAWLAVETGRESIKALRAEVEAATQNYSDLQSQYDVGTTTSLDVQTALRDLNNSRTLLTNQVYDYQVALRNLQRAEAVFEQSRVQKAKIP